MYHKSYRDEILVGIAMVGLSVSEPRDRVEIKTGQRITNRHIYFYHAVHLSSEDETSSGSWAAHNQATQRSLSIP